MWDVSIVPCADYSPAECRCALEDVLAPLGGLSFVTPGMRVAVKANLFAFKRPDTAAVTHPALVTALCEMLVERGASVVVGDSPGGLFSGAFLGGIYAATGMTAVTATGARLNDDFRTVDVACPDAVAAKSLHLTQYLLDADAVIDFCKLKTHGLMAYTGACKNMFGAVAGTRKSEYHYLYPDHAAFANMLVDVCEAVRPRLCIADAVMAMEGNGPSGGTPRFLGAVLASQSAHALDLCGASLMGLTMSDVPTLFAAHERGLLPATLGELTVHGDPDAFAVTDFKLVPKQDVTLWGLKGKVSSGVLRRLFATRPVADRTCIGCGKCRDVCPAHAITMRKKRPVIDKNACIRCFCCQEFCPKGAMKVRRALAARLLNR